MVRARSEGRRTATREVGLGLVPLGEDGAGVEGRHRQGSAGLAMALEGQALSDAVTRVPVVGVAASD